MHCDEGTLRSSGFVDPKDDTVCFRSSAKEMPRKNGGNTPGGNQEIGEFFFAKGKKVGPLSGCIFFCWGGKRE